MKLNPFVTSYRSKNHKRHFNAPSHTLRRIVFFFQRAETEVQCFIHAHLKDDEVQIVLKGSIRKEYELKACNWRKLTGTILRVGIPPSKVLITRKKLGKEHKEILEDKAKSHQVGKEKGKYKEETIEKVQE